MHIVVPGKKRIIYKVYLSTRLAGIRLRADTLKHFSLWKGLEWVQQSECVILEKPAFKNTVTYSKESEVSMSLDSTYFFTAMVIIWKKGVWNLSSDFFFFGMQFAWFRNLVTSSKIPEIEASSISSLQFLLETLF